MQPESGQRALRAAGLQNEFLAGARPEGQQMRLVGRDGRIQFDAVPSAADTLAVPGKGFTSARMPGSCRSRRNVRCPAAPALSVP
ncbi:hypothetical protein GCM10010277_04640 [Streptomyces longisporoflavus]|uniref:hypothetical protein n=1 Tax=Streptomyces longisporoflavus TaxID=28044 RepID=UPI00167EEA9C|nr:hypothetical protein [Streptomyces longisporoflavus]GGV24373.1 hypothetical protein GCM10010277_04640 [Streptomyces longisporoflavus]